MGKPPPVPTRHQAVKRVGVQDSTFTDCHQSVQSIGASLPGRGGRRLIGVLGGGEQPAPAAVIELHQATAAGQFGE